MKPVQITIDERLLARLDSDPDVKRRGRSAVIRRLLTDYLRNRRRRAIGRAYERAYKSVDPLQGEWERWAEEGTWPEE
jgi:metal-responsive CopG/Arc/MetJ family transcriptional regulator